jgi:hypothetical protein
MTTETISQALVGGQLATFGQGRVWYIKSATAALSLTCESLGSGASVRRFVNVGAGFKFVAQPGDGWTYLRVLSAVSQNIEIIIGDDDVTVANAVSVTGSVITVENPATTVADSPAVVRPNASQGVLIPANIATRKRITIYADSQNLASCFARVAGGANNIAELQPGIGQQFAGTYALDVRNDSGAAATFYIFEEN